MGAEMFALSILFMAIAAVCITFAVQMGRVFRARAAAMHETEYRELLRQSNEAHARVAESLDRAVAEIASLRARIESTERLLQEVG